MGEKSAIKNKRATFIFLDFFMVLHWNRTIKGPWPIKPWAENPGEAGPRGASLCFPFVSIFIRDVYQVKFQQDAAWFLVFPISSPCSQCLAPSANFQGLGVFKNWFIFSHPDFTIIVLACHNPRGNEKHNSFTSWNEKMLNYEMSQGKKLEQFKFPGHGSIIYLTPDKCTLWRKKITFLSFYVEF